MSTKEGRASKEEYRLLHKYLHDRYADRLVLTFAQIEDLLGFPLPAAARLQADWWAGTDAVGGSTQAASWILADRTATVNMASQSVVFERDTP